MAFITANWMQILVVVLAVDSALVPIFPTIGIFGVIKNILTALQGAESASVKTERPQLKKE